MRLLGTLRGQLDAKGYERLTHPSLPLTFHLHALINASVLLYGSDSDEAKTYQQDSVDAAIRKR